MLFIFLPTSAWDSWNFEGNDVTDTNVIGTANDKFFKVVVKCSQKN